MRLSQKIRFKTGLHICALLGQALTQIWLTTPSPIQYEEYILFALPVRKDTERTIVAFLIVDESLDVGGLMAGWIRDNQVLEVSSDGASLTPMIPWSASSVTYMFLSNPKRP